MKKIIRWLISKEDKFFEVLKEQSENTLGTAKELKDFVDNYHKLDRIQRKLKAQAIKNIKHKGDYINYKIIERLNKDFKTQINKEYLNQIAVLIYDIVDLIDAVASRFVMFGIERIDNYIIKLVDISINAVTELNKTISKLKKVKEIKEHNNILSLEKEADDTYQEAISELFHFYKNSIDIIKYKEIYELLKKIANKCKKVANIIEGVTSKHP